MSREEVCAIMGKPKYWSPKPPDPIGKMMEAPGWFYYDEAVGIGFDDVTGISTGTTVATYNLNKNIEPFLDWPIGPGSTMGQLREYVEKLDIPWRESPKNDRSYSIVINDHWCAVCGRYEKGKLVPRLDREIVFMCFNIDPKKLLSEWKPKSKYVEGRLIRDRPGFIRNPYDLKQIIDVRGKAAGEKITCPKTGKIFIVP